MCVNKDLKPHEKLPTASFNGGKFEGCWYVQFYMSNISKLK